MKRIINWIRRLFKKESPDGLIGEWGVWNPETNESKVCGEMYSYQGKWIPGP